MFRRRIWRSTGLVLSSCVLSLIIAEAVLRIANVKFDASLYGEDSITGWRLRPGSQGWWVSEGYAYVRINSAGMHDREYPIKKGSTTVRIAVLGDSMTAAVQVDVDLNFTRVLERGLNSCGRFPGKTVEVMNFGVPGYGTAQELLTFRHRVLRYQPDGVILALYTYNDIQNNERTLNPVNASQSPYFVFKDDKLVLDDSFRERMSTIYGPLRDTFGDMANRSRMAQLVAEVVVRRGFLRLQKRQEAAEVAAHFGERADELIYAPPEQPEMKQAWRVTEAVILTLAEEARSHGVNFWLVTLSQSPQHLPPALREQQAKEHGIKDLFYPDRRLEAFAANHQIPALILAPILAEKAVRDPAPLTFGYGHYDDHGHRVVGDTIAARLCGGL